MLLGDTKLQIVINLRLGNGFFVFLRRGIPYKKKDGGVYERQHRRHDSEGLFHFAKKHNAMLTVMEGGEHWFHTEEQMRFLDEWIIKESV